MVGSGSRALPPSAQGNLISEYLPNVRTKTKKAHGSSQHAHTTSTTSSSIADLSSAITQLELTTNPSIPNKPRTCTCNASIHPLFTMAPNCTSCGKIICALEGLQPCSFCGTPLISTSETHEILTSLRQERGHERQNQHNTSVSASRSGTPSLSSTPSKGLTPASSSESLRQVAALEEATARRDRLLAFQSENAQRTMVHDEAADFSMITPGQAQWMTPMQRAAALKQQQKYLRDLEEASRPEYEKTRNVMSLGFNKQGKLVKTYEKQRVPSSDVHDTPEQPEQVVQGGLPGTSSSSQNTKTKQRSTNPLVSAGLIRPVWKPQENGGNLEQGHSRKAQSAWRKVQDDED